MKTLLIGFFLGLNTFAVIWLTCGRVRYDNWLEDQYYKQYEEPTPAVRYYYPYRHYYVKPAAPEAEEDAPPPPPA